MSQDKHVLHLRSNQSNNYPTSDKTLSGTPIMDYGEIAINYAVDNEFISIKNSNNTLTLFRAWPFIEQVILDNELVTASALTTLKESCGFNENAEFTPSADANYISDSKTVTSALNTLDSSLNQAQTSISEIQKAIDYQSGYNTVTTLSNIPQTKRSVLCTVSSDQTFYLNTSGTLMPDGQEIHILIQNTNTINNITVAYSTNSAYVRMSGDSLTIKPSSWGEINAIRLGDKYYVRGL